MTRGLLVWEVFGGVEWATGCLTQSRRHLNGQERSVELAVLGRLAAEMEYELLDLQSSMRHDRPTPQELAEAVREVPPDGDHPLLSDRRLEVRTLVAINGLGIAERELWATVAPREED